MAGLPGYTVEEARADAREWIKGATVHDGSRGWRVCCAILDERLDELEAERDHLRAALGLAWIAVPKDEPGSRDLHEKIKAALAHGKLKG